MSDDWLTRRCDFCNQTGVSSAFDCTGGVDSTGWSPKGTWHGCTECSLLINLDAWPELVSRSTRGSLRLLGASGNSALTFEVSWQCIDAFRTARGTAVA